MKVAAKHHLPCAHLQPMGTSLPVLFHDIVKVFAEVEWKMSSCSRMKWQLGGIEVADIDQCRRYVISGKAVARSWDYGDLTVPD